MSTAWFVAVCLLAAPADGTSTADVHKADSAQAQPKDLPDAVQDALRRFRRTSPGQREHLVPEFVALYEQVQRDGELGPKHRQRLLRVLEHRLRQAEGMLERRISRARRRAIVQSTQRQPKKAEQAVATVKVPAGQPGVLTQQLVAQGQGAGGGGGGLRGPQGGQIAANAQQLIDLIRATICPDTWAVNGGNGRIFYYSPLQVLVVTR
jgi:hypothetical protein